MRYPVQEMMLRVLRFAPLLLLFTACEKDGGTPAFIRPRTPVVKSASGDTLFSNITELWIYANDAPIGVWQPNRRVPVLSTGSTQLKFVAGIRKNGITESRIQYPFLATYTLQTDLLEGQEQEISPVFSYYEEPPWVEDFESQSFNLDLSESDTTLIVYDRDVNAQEVLNGDGSGGFVLSTEHPSFRALSSGDPAFPSGSVPVFLEFDCRSDMRFLIGVRYTLSGQVYTVPYVYVTATGVGNTLGWKHMYIDLGSAWPLSGTTDRRFYIQGDLENGATSGKVTLDNLTVHF